MNDLKPVLLAAAMLGGFTIVGTGLVALVNMGTIDRIAANERDALLRNIRELVPNSDYDNEILDDTIQLSAPDALGSSEPVTVFQARKKGQPVAAVLTVIAADGYSGEIKVLVAIRADGSLAGVRALSHKETPGLGDGIEIKRSRWVESFNGKSLFDPKPEQWGVKKDGGVFDQFTGATITPRAVVKAVYKALLYFRDHRSLFWPAPPATPAQPVYQETQS